MWAIGAALPLENRCLCWPSTLRNTKSAHYRGSTQCFRIKQPPSSLVSNTEKKEKPKAKDAAPTGSYKRSFTTSAFPFSRVSFDGQHYLFCHRGTVLRAGKCIFMVLQDWWKKASCQPKSKGRQERLANEMWGTLGTRMCHSSMLQNLIPTQCRCRDGPWNIPQERF